jgi:hypothetical protein
MNVKNTKINKMNSKPMNVQVPKSVNVKELVKGLELSPTCSENIKNKVYYFLSLLALSNENYGLNEKTDGYRRISSVLMKKIMGRKDYYRIIKLLSNPLDPIIESKRSWRSSTKGSRVGYCIGYRLTQKYNTGEIDYKTLPGKTQNRIYNHLKDDLREPFDDSKYYFLYDQYTSHTLSFDPSVYDYIRSFGQKLLSRIPDGNEFQTNMVLNLIGRWLYYVEKFENNDLWYKVSPDNHRLNSSITHLKKTLRPFLLCDGKSLGMIDISASQPCFLSFVMSNNFLAGNPGGFNLQSIYPEVFNILVANGSISNTGMDIQDSFNYASYSGSSMHTDFNINSGSSSGIIQNTYSFMWGSFFDEHELESIERYQTSPFEDDFYKYLLKTNQSITGNPEDISPAQRQKLKDNMMYILFDDNLGHRNNNEYIKMFKSVYPGVDKLICSLHKQIGSDKFAYLLQRTESYIMLDLISREFYDKYPLLPVFTIHDEICTYPEYLPDLKEMILERFQEITDIRVGIKTSLWEPVPEPKPEDIEKEWMKIKPINTLKSYQKKNYSVFSSNIQRGSRFLSDHL